MKKMLLILMLLGIIMSCAVEPAPIKYGHDACHFCEMTIVSKAHAARAVSKKGKQFKYDAIECMVHDELKHEVPMAIRQVADLSAPGVMIPVDHAIFVINDSINSPMGANLGALNNSTNSERAADYYTWEELISFFSSANELSLN